MADKEVSETLTTETEWTDTGVVFGGSKILARGDERKLVDPEGKLLDFHYSMRR